MNPATLHAVVTPEASICHGGHFYTMSTMSNTVYGIMHTFVGSSVLTNTQHTADSRMLLRRSVSHVYSLTVAENFRPSSHVPTPKSAHVPKLNTVEGVVDFFNLLNVTELGGILNPFSYNPGLQIKERVRIIHARKLSRTLLRWFWCNYELREIVDGKSKVVQNGERFYYECLGRQTKTLWEYKKVAEQCGMMSDVEDCTAEAVAASIKKAFQGNTAFWDGFNRAHGTSLSWCNLTFEVCLRQPPAAFNLSDCGE